MRESVELSPADTLGEADLVNLLLAVARRGESTLMPSLRSDTTFLVLLVAILLAALAVTGMETPDAPRHAQITPRPLPTPTGTPTPGWWGEVAFATPTLPALPGMPNVQLGGGGQAATPVVPSPSRSSPAPAPPASSAITRNGVWWLIDGTATTDAFGYWKVELSADGANWTTLYRSETPVSGGRLMEFHTATVKKGEYKLRLVVVKQDGNYPEPCVLAVAV